LTSTSGKNVSMPLSAKYAAVSNVRLHFWSPASAKTEARLAEEKGVLGVQETMRPSAFVVPENFGVEEVEDGEVDDVEEWRVRVTGIFAPGRPSVVSRTWHVIGGFFSAAVVVVDIVVGCIERLGGVERWFERASMRCVVDMRWVGG
jgi:hypothetical protein